VGSGGKEGGESVVVDYYGVESYNFCPILQIPTSFCKMCRCRISCHPERISAASAGGSLIRIGAGRGQAVGTPIPIPQKEAQCIEMDTTDMFNETSKSGIIYLLYQNM